MSDTFAARAAALCGLAAHALGWRPAEFWAATPSELALSLGEATSAPDLPPTRTQIEQMMRKETGHG